MPSQPEHRIVAPARTGQSDTAQVADSTAQPVTDAPALPSPVPGDEAQLGQSCIRWGGGADRCVRHYDHTGPCRDSEGNTTLTLAQWLVEDARDGVETAEYHELEHRFREDVENGQ